MEPEEPTQEPTMEQLLQRFGRNDQAARRVLVERYRDRVWRIAYGLLGREADAWDAAQEVFVKMMTRHGRFGSAAQFESWLYRVTHNVAMDAFRRSRRWRVLPEDAPDPSARDPEAAAGAEGREGLEGVEAKETRSSVQRVLDRLPPKYRAALILREMENQSPEKIAKAFHIPAGLARWRVFRAREMFRQIWEREYGRFEE